MLSFLQAFLEILPFEIRFRFEFGLLFHFLRINFESSENQEFILFKQFH